MKKLLKISAVTLVLAVIFVTAGSVWVNHDKVNPGSIYALAEEHLKIGESNVEYTMPQKRDLSDVVGKKTGTSARCELNEFNTLEIYAENCDISFDINRSDAVTAALVGGELTTAVTGGALYIQAVARNERGDVTIGVPESFKGAFFLNASRCSSDLGSLDSTMDIGFNLHECSITTDNISADSVTFLMSGSTFSARSMTSPDGVSVTATASDITLKNIDSKYSTFTVNNTTLRLGAGSGAVMCDARLSEIAAAFSEVTGNITFDLTACRAAIKIPDRSDLVVRHSEDYGLYTDETNSAQNEGSKPAVHYTMETNIKFGIVTVTN